MATRQRKPRIGRPPLPVEARKGTAINFRCRVEEADRIDTLADVWGVDRREAVIRAVDLALAELTSLRCTDCSAVMPEGADGWEIDAIPGEGKRARCPLHSTAGRMRRATATTKGTR